MGRAWILAGAGREPWSSAGRGPALQNKQTSVASEQSGAREGPGVSHHHLLMSDSCPSPRGTEQMEAPRLLAQSCSVAGGAQMGLKVARACPRDQAEHLVPPIPFHALGVLLTPLPSASSRIGGCVPRCHLYLLWGQTFISQRDK